MRRAPVVGRGGASWVGYNVENIRRLGLTIEDVAEGLGYPRGMDELRLGRPTSLVPACLARASTRDFGAVSI